MKKLGSDLLWPISKGGELMTESEVKASWDGSFERLYHADPLAAELDVRGVAIPIADPPINCELPLQNHRLR